MSVLYTQRKATTHISIMSKVAAQFLLGRNLQDGEHLSAGGVGLACDVQFSHDDVSL